MLAQQAQLAGGYLASPDACSEEGAVIVFRVDNDAAARFLAVLPVVLVWSDWPDTAKTSMVTWGEGAEPMRSIRVKVAMHVSSEVRVTSARTTDSQGASRASTTSTLFESGPGSSSPARVSSQARRPVRKTRFRDRPFARSVDRAAKVPSASSACLVRCPTSAVRRN